MIIRSDKPVNRYKPLCTNFSRLFLCRNGKLGLSYGRIITNGDHGNVNIIVKVVMDSKIFKAKF